MHPQPTIDELVIADEPDAWRALGFAVDGDTAEVGSVRLRFEGRGERRGIVRWFVRGARSLELDGLDTHASERPPAAGAEHPNGVVAIDHVVVLTPDLDRTAGVLRGAGFDFRRMREGPTPGGSVRQAFFRMGEVILELVLAPEGTSVAADPDGARAPVGHLVPGAGHGAAGGGARRAARRAARRRPAGAADRDAAPRRRARPGRRVHDRQSLTRTETGARPSRY